MSSSVPAWQIFGMSMQRRSARRRLVVVTYVMLALISAGALVLSQQHAWVFSYAIYAATAVGIFIFGGQGRYGLIKPFVNKPPRPEPPMVDLIRLHLDPMTVGMPETSAWRNDERELARRDAAHYQAHQPLSIALLAMMLLAAWALHPPRWVSVPVLLELMLSVTVIACVLAVTLPSAIILWTEPDIDFS